MDQRYAEAVTVPTPPKSDAQCSAERWHTAKDELARALADSNAASARLQQAQAEEQEAWRQLEQVAGRSAVNMAVTGGSMAPRLR